jgi:hypothetical protein
MSQFLEDLQYKLKASSGSALLFSFKIFMGFVLGLTFALIGQQMTNYGSLAFLLVILSTMAVFYRISRGWQWAHSFVFALICVLVGLLLRMYILIAPGA